MNPAGTSARDESRGSELVPTASAARRSRVRFSIMFVANVLCHPWDIEDEGIDRVLDHVQGELGAGGITVLASGPRVCALRRHPGASRRVMQSRGGLYYQPDGSKYGSTRIKPSAAGWLKTRNPLAKIADACRRRGLDLRVAVYTRRLERLAERLPECTVKNCFGDVSTGRFCQHNPDAAEFFRAVVTDLSTNYGVAAVEFCDLDRPFETDMLDRPAIDHLGPAGAGLFAVCFCESCLQAARSAGIDTDAAVRSTQLALSAAIESGRPIETEFDEHIAEHAPLRDFVADRTGSHVVFIASLTAQAVCDTALHVSPARLRAAAAFDAPLDTIIVDLDHSAIQDAALMSPFANVRIDARREVQVPARGPAGVDAAALVKTLNRLTDEGVDGITLDHYGQMGDIEFTAAKQAIRYARRTATA